ncbi:MAG: MATE family efflux transporter [Hominenteromicrobium sp.]
MVKTENSIVDGVIWKQLLLFFFPILIGTFFQQLYNTVDTVIVGQFVGKAALAAVGTTGTVINLLVGFFVGVSSGATVIISQFFGAEDPQNVSKAVHTSIALALAGGAVIMAVGLLTARPVLEVMNVPEDILDDAVLYMNVYYAGIIACMVYNIGTGVLRAIGDSRMPLYILIVCCLANVLLDLLFVVAFRWAVFGVALATVLSQVISAALVMARLMLTQEAYRVELRKIRFDAGILRNVIRIGLPSGLQSVMYSFSNILIQTSINGFGTDAIAAWSAIGKIDGFIWMVMNAFGISVTTFVGQNFGARRYDRVKRSTHIGLLMALGSTITLSVLLFALREPLLRLFTDDAEVVRLGANFFKILAPSYFTFVFIEIFSGAIRGAGESLQPMLITCFGVCGLRIVWLLIAVPLWHTMEMIALNYPVTWVTTAVVFIVYYARGRWLDRCIRREHDPSHTTLRKKAPAR